MHKNSGGPIEWLIPLAFVATASWLVWHLPAFLLDWLPYTSESLKSQVTEIYLRSDVTPELPGVFGGLSTSSTWLRSSFCRFLQ